MKRKTGLLPWISLLLAFGLTAAAAAQKPRIFPYDVHAETLDNGLRVILVPMSSGGLVAYWSIVRTGARDEYEPGRTGFAHFFEHMMFRGTETYPAEVYNGIMTEIGADTNAFTSSDLTAYHLSIAAADLETVMKLESDRFLNLSYPEEMFQTEAGAVYGEYRKNRTNPFFVIREALYKEAFEKHTYGHTAMGYEEDIKQMPSLFDYSKSFFSRYYRPENVVLLITGDIDAAATMAMAKRYYGSWQPGYVPPQVPAEPPQTAERRIRVAYEGSSLPIVWMAYKSDAFSPGDRTYVASSLFCDLAFGQTSELYKKLVLEEQVVEFLQANQNFNRDPGLIDVVTRVKDPAKVDYVIAEIDRVIAEARESPPDARRLADLQARLKYSFLMRLDTPSNVARGLARWIAVAGTHEVVDQLYATADAVTPADVLAAARKYFAKEQRTVGVLRGQGASAPTPQAAAAGDSRAILLPVPDDPTVTFKVWFRVGSHNDPPGKEGLAALTGALISEGSTLKNSYEEILKELYPLASAYDVRVDKEMTTLTGRTHADNVDAFFELLTDAYLRPAFTEEDFDRLRADYLNYLETTLRYSSDEELGKAALAQFVFDGTPYRHPIAGTVAGLQAITLEDVRRFFATFYTRDNATVALGGGYSEELVRRFESTLADLGAGAPPAPPAIAPPAIAGRHVMLVSKPNADASISFGFPISVQRGERDFYALWIANSWLGEHRNSSSHLYQVIREARGMNYGDYSYIESFPEGGRRQMPPPNVARNHQLFEVWIRTLPNEQAHFALRAAVRELEDLIAGGMTEEEFELTRSFLSKYYLHFAETTETRLGYAVDDRFYGIGGEGHLARFGEMIGSITRDEVNAALKKHLQAANLKIAIVTGQAEELAAALKNDTPSPMTYSSPKPDAVLAEDKEIERFPLAIASVTTVPVAEIFEK